MKLTRCFMMIFGLCWLLAAAPRPADAGVRIGVDIGIDLPVLTFRAPPELAVIPGSYIYYVPDVEESILFFQGHWYRPWRDRWYRSRNYGGPWDSIGLRYVPAPLLQLPPDYRPGRIYQRLKPHDVDRHWQRWERERYWEHGHDWWRERPEGHHGGDRDDHRERHHRYDRDDHNRGRDR